MELLALLNRGLKFCPTPGRPDVGLLSEDIYNLHRRFRQFAFFDNPENNPDPTLTPQVDPGNLLVSSPFKHFKFKLSAEGKGLTGPPNLEAMIITN